ncbi:uncharacterized protein LOC121367530 [Gigantopelta aegis]|uniref:uncharacterized protein LOC121367530 n=1 Tax=Gigantopelta aegis TaxID=1735272 RepID=UPI001B8896FD|nr:uncharacterized protein LOC121367530 [Gigantopelta aegis]
MKSLIITCLCLSVVYAAPARHAPLHEFLEPFKDLLHEIEQELKPVIHGLVDEVKETATSAASQAALSDLTSLLHNKKRNFFDDLLAPLKAGFQKTKEQLKPYLHQIGHNLLNQTKTLGASALSQSLTAVLSKAFSNLFHGRRSIKRNFFDDLLAPLKAGFQKTKEQLKPYLHQVGHNLLNQTKTLGASALSQSLTAVLSKAFSNLFHGRRSIKRNFFDDLLAPLKAGFQKTKEQLKPYLHQIGHNLLNQTKTLGASALSQSLTAVLSKAFSNLFHGRRNIKRNFFDDLLAPLKAGFQKTKEQLKPYLHQIGHNLLNQTKTLGASALSQSLTAVLSNAFSKLFHGRRNIEREGLVQAVKDGFEKTVSQLRPYVPQVEHSLAGQTEKEVQSSVKQIISDLVKSVMEHIDEGTVEKIGEFAAKLNSVLDTRINQLLEIFDQGFKELQRLSIKVSRRIIHPEIAVHNVDAVVAQHHITGDLVVKYLKKDLRELLTPGKTPDLFVEVLHKVGIQFGNVFDRLQKMVTDEGQSIKTRFLARIQHQT